MASANKNEVDVHHNYNRYHGHTLNSSATINKLLSYSEMTDLIRE